MKNKVSTMLKVFILATIATMASCNKEDDFAEPEGSITLNMHNEDNGKTLLANSNVYINRASNFYTSSNLISEIGKVPSLGAKTQPNLNSLTQEVALIPGNAYQIFNPNSIIEFPSGKTAILKGNNYYQVYVKSFIKDNDTEIGAVVKYVLLYPNEKSLPEPDLHIGNLDSYEDELILTVNKNTEYAFAEHKYEDVFSIFDISKTGDKLIIKLKKEPNNIHGPYGDYYLYLRLNNVCVRLRISVLD